MDYGDKENKNGPYMDSPESLKKKGDKIRALAEDNPVQNTWKRLKTMVAGPQKPKGLIDEES
jgi:hypothetical protein